MQTVDAKGVMTSSGGLPGIMDNRVFCLKWLKSSLLCLLWLSATAGAAEIFVDNRLGSDALDGMSAQPVSSTSGPTKTIGRALGIARPGDTVVIANTGKPYYESLRLVGSRHSGRGTPFTIEGNAAVVSGAARIPPNSWREVEPSLWKVTPWRKGFYQLLQGDGVIPEVACPAGAASLPEIAPGHWCAWRGSIYYRSNRDEKPSDAPMAIAHLDVGLTLYAVRNVQIHNLTFQHFRLDGVNAHDLCRGVDLQEIRSKENGRAGIVVAGSSRVRIENSELTRNRRYSLLISEQAVAILDKTVLSEPATFED